MEQVREAIWEERLIEFAIVYASMVMSENSSIILLNLRNKPFNIVLYAKKEEQCYWQHKQQQAAQKELAESVPCLQVSHHLY